MTLTAELFVLGILLTAIGVAFLVLRAEVRSLRRTTPPPSAPVVPRRFEDAPQRQVFDVAPPPRPAAHAVDDTAVLFRVLPEDPTVVMPRLRGGRHAAR